MQPCCGMPEFVCLYCPQVVVRVRPMNERETTAGETMAVQLSETDTTTLQVKSVCYLYALLH